MTTPPEDSLGDPQAALRQVQTAGEAMGRRAAAPAWYHLGLGLIMGGMSANIVMGVTASRAWSAGPQLAVTAVLLGALTLLVTAYRRRKGLWVSGFRAGRTYWVALSLMVLVGVVIAVAISLAGKSHAAVAALASAGVNFLIVTAAGYLWEAAYRADLRAGGRP